MPEIKISYNIINSKLQAFRKKLLHIPCPRCKSVKTKATGKIRIETRFKDSIEQETTICNECKFVFLVSKRKEYVPFSCSDVPKNF